MVWKSDRGTEKVHEKTGVDLRGTQKDEEKDT